MYKCMQDLLANSCTALVSPNKSIFNIPMYFWNTLLKILTCLEDTQIHGIMKLDALCNACIALTVDG